MTDLGSSSGAVQQHQDRVPCANIKQKDGSTVNCDNRASLSCGKCHLVQYCGRECQVAHWGQHKLDCNSDLRKTVWQPTWARQRRQPAFVSYDVGPMSFGDRRYLYGNVPAYDVLNLTHNEGKTHHEDLNLCLAASGDLRNVMKSINRLPDTYAGTCTCVINDKDQIVATRNVVMLLVALLLPPVEAADLILHIWYSARLTARMLQMVKDRVHPLIAEVVEKIKQKRDDVVLSKTWTFGTRKLSVRLYKQQWSFALRVLESNHSVSKTEEQRRFVMLNDTRVDHRERHLFRLSPSRRVCSLKNRESGVLLPFGNYLTQYNHPNPTLFDATSGMWLLKDSSDQQEGWRIEDVLESGAKHRIPKEDTYGHLHSHVLDTIEQFCRKIALFQTRLQLYSTNAATLPSLLDPHLKGSAFDRIEVSNIADIGYLGLEPTLSILRPLLKSPKQNPHAVLIMLFMNAIEQIAEASGSEHDVESMMTCMKKASRFLPYPSDLQNTWDPSFLRLSAAKMIFRDYDKFFEQYMHMVNFALVSSKTGLKMKTKNTVIEAWPMRLKKVFGEPGAKEAFDRLQVVGSVGNERYVEWVRSG